MPMPPWCRTVRQTAGDPGPARQPPGRHQLGPWRPGPADRIVVEDPQDQDLADRPGPRRCRAAPAVGSRRAGPLRRSGPAADVQRRPRPLAAADQHRWQQPVPGRCRCLAGRRPPVR
ncbi:hypothetical protein G6F60_014231 [Rhizopus arrhizus]|nr:hypothetical protein G6F60_014231 [Rhizopus arrhizus]